MTCSASTRPDRDGRRLRLTRQLRVRRHDTFTQILKRGLRRSDRILTVWMYPNELGHPRLGLIVGRRHGNAPRRNRLKRVIREAFRVAQHDLPASVDYVCSPRVGVSPTARDCVESLTRLAARLAVELRRQGLQKPQRASDTDQGRA